MDELAIGFAVVTMTSKLRAESTTVVMEDGILNDCRIGECLALVKECDSMYVYRFGTS